MESVRYFWIKRPLLIFSWVSSRSSSSSKPRPTSILFHVWCHLGENLIYCWLKPVLSCVALAFYLGWRKWVQSIGDYHFKVCHSDIWTTRSLEGTISSNCLLWWEAGHGTAYFARVHHNLHYHFLYIFVPFIVVLVWTQWCDVLNLLNARSYARWVAFIVNGITIVTVAYIDLWYGYLRDHLNDAPML